jgi:nucleotide-binding universal stress UspA family protein
MYQKILVPLDGSTFAEAALPRVLQLLEDVDEPEIILLRVADNPAQEFAFSDPALAQYNLERARADAAQYLKRIVAQMRAKRLYVISKLVEGSPASAIVQCAEENEVDLIALATHARRGVARSILGSVSDQVVRQSRVPVLLVQPT